MKNSPSVQPSAKGQLKSNGFECLENRQLFAMHMPFSAGSGFASDAGNDTPAVSVPTFQQAYAHAAWVEAYEHFLGLIQAGAFADSSAASNVSVPSQTTTPAQTDSAAVDAGTDNSSPDNSSTVSTPRVDLDRAPATAVQTLGTDSQGSTPTNTQTKTIVDSAKVIPVVATQMPGSPVVNVKIGAPVAHPAYAMASFPTAIPTSAVPNLMNLLSLNATTSVKAPAWMMEASSRVTHSSKQAETVATTADAKGIQTDPSNPSNALLATLDIEHMATRPWWQRLAAATTTALLLVVTWYIRRRNQQRSLVPTGERFSEI